MTIGKQIQAARKSKGLTQKQLADKMQISYVNISQLERDERNPTLETLQRVADALGDPNLVFDCLSVRVSTQISDLKDNFGEEQGRILEALSRLTANDLKRLADVLGDASVDDIDVFIKYLLSNDSVQSVVKQVVELSGHASIGISASTSPDGFVVEKGNSKKGGNK